MSTKADLEKAAFLVWKQNLLATREAYEQAVATLQGKSAGGKPSAKSEVMVAAIKAYNRGEPLRATKDLKTTTIGSQRPLSYIKAGALVGPREIARVGIPAATLIFAGYLVADTAGGSNTRK